MENEKQLNLAEGMKIKPALCLDLDGTVRRSKSGKQFLINFQDIELMPNIEKLIWLYRNMGYLIIAISNQGGVAHGYKLPMEIEHELDTTLKLFNKNPFHIVKCCYHMEDGKIEPFCHRSLLRKPEIGMLAIAEHEAFNEGIIIDWDKSLFVGDRPEDEDCAKNARIKFEHIDSFLVSPKIFEVSDGKKIETDETAKQSVTNIDEAIELFLPRFDGLEETDAFKKGEDDFAAFCHSQMSGGIGMKIRNELNLWDNTSPMHQYFTEKFNCKHPDDMSDLIIRGIYKKMKNK